METTFLSQEIFLPIRSYRTYEEWKHTSLNCIK